MSALQKDNFGCFNTDVNLYKHLIHIYICDCFVFRKNKSNDKMELIGDFGINNAAEMFIAAGWQKVPGRTAHKYFNPIGTVD